MSITKIYFCFTRVSNMCVDMFVLRLFSKMISDFLNWLGHDHDLNNVMALKKNCKLFSGFITEKVTQTSSLLFLIHFTPLVLASYISNIPRPVMGLQIWTQWLCGSTVCHTHYTGTTPDYTCNVIVSIDTVGL